MWDQSWNRPVTISATTISTRSRHGAPKEVDWVDENLVGFKGRVSRDNWVEQAKILAAGGETEFSKRGAKDDAH